MSSSGAAYEATMRRGSKTSTARRVSTTVWSWYEARTRVVTGSTRS